MKTECNSFLGQVKETQGTTVMSQDLASSASARRKQVPQPWMKVHGNEDGRWSDSVMLVSFAYYQQGLNKWPGMKNTVISKRFHRSWHKLPLRYFKHKGLSFKEKAEGNPYLRFSFFPHRLLFLRLLPSSPPGWGLSPGYYSDGSGKYLNACFKISQ